MKLFLLVAFCFFNTSAVLSQSPRQWKEREDTNYIDQLASKWSVRIHTILKHDQFTFSGKEFSSSFKPDFKIAVGIGASYKNLALDLGWTLFSSDPSHKSKNFALLSSMYLGPNAIEITAQFYRHYSVQVFNTNYEQPLVQFRPDIHTLNLGLNYNYNFNYRKFSFDAASIGTKIQKRSAGTLLAGGFLNYFSLNADSSIISSAYANADAMISRANLFSAGISGGCAYVFVLPAHFYVMLSLTPKLGFNSGGIKMDVDQNIPVNITPGFLTRNAIGYSAKKCYGLLSMLLDHSDINTGSDIRLSYHPMKVKLLVGYRFN